MGTGMRFLGDIARNFHHDMKENPMSTVGITLLIPSLVFYLMSGDEKAGYAALISAG